MVGGGGAYTWGHISGITKNVSERGDKTNLRNELKQTYHYIKSYIYNTFTVRHNERRIYLKNIYKTQILMFVKERTYTLDGLINERGGGSYIQDNIFVRKWMGLHPEGFKVGFYGKLLPL